MMSSDKPLFDAVNLTAAQIIDPPPDITEADIVAKTEQMAGFLAQTGWPRGPVNSNAYRAARALALAVLHRKGLLVMGGLGTGKTTFLKALARRTFDRKGFTFVNLKDPVRAESFNRREYPDYIESCLERNLIIDDLGCELPCNHFGTKFEPVIDALFYYISEVRPNETRGKGKLFISTNLEGSKLLERYSVRLECLKEHVIPVHFAGPSQRQWIL